MNEIFFNFSTWYQSPRLSGICSFWHSLPSEIQDSSFVLLGPSRFSAYPIFPLILFVFFFGIRSPLCPLLVLWSSFNLTESTMSEISKAITTLTVQPIEAPLDQSTGELQNIQVAYQLNEKIIICSGPKLWRCSWRGKESSATCSALDQSRVIQNSRIGTRTTPWLCHGYRIWCYLRSVALVYFFPWLKKFGMQWDRLTQKVRDAAQIFEIKTKISATKQGEQSMIEYSNILKNW